MSTIIQSSETYLLAELHLYMVMEFIVVSNGTIPLELMKLKLISAKEKYNNVILFDCFNMFKVCVFTHFLSILT